MNKSTDPYKGVRDFYPEEQFIQNYIFEVMRRVSENFGYVEYNASILEPSDLFIGKTSEEILKEQTYTFEDRAGRSVTLRPEMTPSVSRMVAAKRRELGFPLRWYSIGNMFRYERPQRGRIREHWQLNADIFGSDSPYADAESVALAHAILKEFGASDGQFVIKLNNREALNKLVGKYNLNEEKSRALIQLIDKKDKIDDFEARAKELVGETINFEIEEDARVTKVRALLAERDIANTVFDPTLARGFDYYTGVVFEVFDTNPENPRALFGGGRYDNLLEAYGAEHTPAVGIAMGDVSVRDFLKTHDLLPEYVSSVNLYLCVIDESSVSAAVSLAETLRGKDVAVAVNLSVKRVGDQIKIAVSQKIPFIICVGENEVTSNRYTIKNLASGEEKQVAEDEIADFIWSADL